MADLAPDADLGQDEEGDSDPEIRELEGESLKITLRMLWECSKNALMIEQRNHKHLSDRRTIGSNKFIIVMSAKLFNVSLRTFKENYIKGKQKYYLHI